MPFTGGAISSVSAHSVNSHVHRGLSQALLPTRSLTTSHTLQQVVRAAAKHTAAAPWRVGVQQQHHCYLAAVPASAAGGDPQAANPDSQHAEGPVLWSEGDFYDTVDVDSEVTYTTDSGLQVLTEHAAQQQHTQQQAEATAQHTHPVLAQHNRHQRRFNQQLNAAAQQQHLQQHQQQPSGLHQLQPIIHSFSHVHLLHRVAGIASWRAAAEVLQQEQHSMQAEHVAMLWTRLTPKLQAQQQAAADRARSTTAEQRQQQRVRVDKEAPKLLQEQLQVQHFVVQQLCSLTQQHACSMQPQALTASLQALAAAAGAGKLAAAACYVYTEPGFAPTAAQCVPQAAAYGAVSIDGQLLPLLQQQLLRVAASCSPQQLAACLRSGQQLGWCQHNSSSSGGAGVHNQQCGYCCSVFQAASRGQLGQALTAGTISSLSAAQLLHGLAGCAAAHRIAPQAQELTFNHQQQQQRQQPEQYTQQQQGTSADAVADAVLQQLADAACHVLTAAGETQGHQQHTAGAFAGLGMPPSRVGTEREAALSAAVCSMQAFALLQHMPDPACLEQLLSDLQPHVAASRLDAQQLLTVLQACCELGVEPWPEWLQDCYNSLSDSLQSLQPKQVLQLVAVLNSMTNLQPSQLLLHQLAKMTAVYCSRYSLQQLASLPSGLKQLGFRPEPYWLKDYLAASTVLLTAHQQPQQQQQQQSPARGQLRSKGRTRKRSAAAVTSQEQQQQQTGHSALLNSSAVLSELLAGAGWLSVAPPPEPWLRAVEQALLAAAAMEGQQPQQQQQQQQQQQLYYTTLQIQQQQVEVQHSQQQGELVHVEQLRPPFSDARASVAATQAPRLPVGCASVVSGVMDQWGYTPCPQLHQLLSESWMGDRASTEPKDGSRGSKASMGGTADTVGVVLPAAAAGARADLSDGVLLMHQADMVSSSSSSSPALTDHHGFVCVPNTPGVESHHQWSSTMQELSAPSHLSAAAGGAAVQELESCSTLTSTPSITYDWPSSYDAAMSGVDIADAGFEHGDALLTLVPEAEREDQQSEHHSSSRGSRGSSSTSSRQVSKVMFDTQPRARPLVKPWYRSKLLQLLKSSKVQQTADEPAMAVL